MLGLLGERGLLAGPYTVDLSRVLDGLRVDGGVHLSRAEAVRWAMAFIQLTGGLEEGADEAEIREMLAAAYDDLRTRLGVDN